MQLVLRYWITASLEQKWRGDCYFAATRPPVICIRLRLFLPRSSSVVALEERRQRGGLGVGRRPVEEAADSCWAADCRSKAQLRARPRKATMSRRRRSGRRGGCCRLRCGPPRPFTFSGSSFFLMLRYTSSSSCQSLLWLGVFYCLLQHIEIYLFHAILSSKASVLLYDIHILVIVFYLLAMLFCIRNHRDKSLIWY